MEKVKNIIWGVLCSFVSFAIVSCSHDEPTIPIKNSDEDNIWYKGILNYSPIVTNVVSRSDQNSTYEPANGDILLLHFYTPNNRSVSGYACYNSTSGVWELSYKGTLEVCSNLKCEVTYIGNNPILNSEQNLVELGLNCPIYECDNGVYHFNNSNKIDLHAQLSPATARIKFKGNKESNFLIKGVNGLAKICVDDYWTYFDYTGGLSGAISAPEYYSPYYYIASQLIGHYYDFIDCRNLWIKEGSTVYVWKKNISNYLEAGSSGIILLPDVAPNDWHSDSYRVKDVSDITIAPKNSGWTQTQDITRFYSNIGIQISFDYTITSCSSYDEYINYPFAIGIWGYDESGNYVTRYDYYFHRDWLIEDLNTTESFYYTCFIEGAAYYQIQFYGSELGTKITNFKISTF